MCAERERGDSFKNLRGKYHSYVLRRRKVDSISEQNRSFAKRLEKM